MELYALLFGSLVTAGGLSPRADVFEQLFRAATGLTMVGAACLWSLRASVLRNHDRSAGLSCRAADYADRTPMPAAASYIGAVTRRSSVQPGLVSVGPLVSGCHAARCTARHGLSSVANPSALNCGLLWNVARHPSSMILARLSP
jgi:hypothetical protein